MNAKTQSQRPFPARASERGFTLIEIMVVIVIIGMLAALVAPNVIGAGDEARAGTAKAQAKTIADSVRRYRSKTGSLPESLEDLVKEDGSGELEELPLDPWDTPYELIPGENSRLFEVISCGPDKQPETEDDISSKAKREDN